jgi:TonB family protein
LRVRTSVRLTSLAFVFLTAAAEPEEPRPRLLNLEELATADDYPSAAAAGGQEGTAVIEAHVDRRGLVTSCRVTSSSGHSALDEQSCALFRARARFEPARDASGRAIASTYRRPMTWRLEGEAEPALPRQAWIHGSRVRLNAKGEAVTCEVTVVGLPPMPDTCGYPRATNSAASTGEEVVFEGMMDTHFLPARPVRVTVPPDRPGINKIAQQIIEVAIDPDGQVTECKVVKYIGAANPASNLCRHYNLMRFVPAPDGRTLIATIINTDYVGNLDRK